MYHEYNVFICDKKRVHEIFLEPKLQVMYIASLSRFKNYFLIYAALQTLGPPDLRPSQILNTFNVWFSSDLNRLTL